MFLINSFSISKLNNAEITGYYINVQKAITSGDTPNLGLSEVLPAYSAKLQQLIDQVYTTTGSEYTAAMLAADVKRDQTYKRIRLRLQMVDVAEDNAAIKAVKDVVKTHLLAKYGAKVPQLPYQEESAIIQGFIYDLHDKLGNDGMAALGLTEDVTALDDANTAFITAYNARSVERAEGDTGLTLKLRQEMFAIYQQVCFIVQYLANSTDEENAAKAEACQAFIAVLNVLLADVRKRYNQRTNNGSTEDDDEGGEGENGGSSDSGNSENGETSENGGENSGSGDDPSNSSNPSNPSNPSEGDNPSEGGDPDGGNVNGGEVTF